MKLKKAKEITVPMSEVVEWEKNPKYIRKERYEDLKKQILELTLYRRLLACKENGKYIILGGNQRLKILRELKEEQVGIALVHAPDDATKLKYALSDNDQAGETDDMAMAELMYKAQEKAKEIDLSMFRIAMAKPVSAEAIMQEFGPKIEAGEEDRIPEPQKEAIAKIGDLYELGPHRLLCGDATDPENYDALLEGQKADLVFTDPPYNVAYTGQKYGPILGDNMSEAEYVEFVLAFINRMKDNLKRGGVFYICSGYSSYPIFVYAIREAGLVFSCPIIWVKNTTSMGWGDYRHKHEMILKAKKGSRKAQPILYGWNGGRHYFMDHKFEADVWEIARRSSQTMLHPTQKPLGLIQRAIRNSSRPKEGILDPFAGSGSTIIAAEREGRHAFAMELDPLFIDVTIRRYAAQGGPNEAKIRATKREIRKEPQG